VAETSCWVLVYLEKILGLENIEKSKLTIAHLSTVLVNLFFNIFFEGIFVAIVELRIGSVSLFGRPSSFFLIPIAQ